jgi:hypothetical protein
VVLALVAGLYVVVLAVASSDPVEARLHDRVGAALRARLGEVRLDHEVEIDPLFRVSFGPLEIPRPGGGPPLLRAQRVTVRPSLLALLRGRLEPATVLLGDVRVLPGPGGRDLEGFVAQVRRRRVFRETPGARDEGDAAGGRDLPKLKLRGLVVVIPRRGEALELGPIDADVRVRRSAEGPRLDATVSLRRGGRIVLDAARADGAWRASLHARLRPEAIPPALRSAAATLAGGEATLDVEAEAPADLSRATASLRAGVEGLVLTGERVAPEPVGPLDATASARVAWDRPSRRVVLSDGVATLQHAAAGTASGELHLGPPATFTAALRAEGVEWGSVVAALPRALALPPDAPRPAGRISARLDVSGPLLALDEWTVAAAVDLSALREAGRRAGRAPLADPFLHRPPLDGGGRGPELRVGPASPDFVPLAELPEYVIRAVTTAEDGGFFAHAGFDFFELRNAIAAGARRGKVVRGGSTISQQVAKNLFLGPERNFARKVREAAITVGLEATLPKRRILEIYLNVAEWGPGVWGIGPAARHWFGKDARALTPKEAAFLASVIPSPVRYHEHLFARGTITETWDTRVRDLLFTMNQQGSLDDGQLAEALDAQIVFASAATAAAATAAPAPAEPADPEPPPSPER